MRFLELKIPPVAVFVLIGLAMWGTTTYVPRADMSFPGAAIAAILLLIGGIVLSVSAIRRFRQHDTTVHPSNPEKASAVVTTGVYRHTRNPMYLALTMVLAAWALKLGNVAALVGVPLFVAYMTQFQIKPEERALRELFGGPYDDYLNSVRRWL